jgi:hypothetical protein
MSYGVTETYRENRKTRQFVNMMPSCAVASPLGPVDDVEISRAQLQAGRRKGNGDKFRYRCLPFEPTTINTKSLDTGKIAEEGTLARGPESKIPWMSVKWGKRCQIETNLSAVPQMLISTPIVQS